MDGMLNIINLRKDQAILFFSELLEEIYYILPRVNNKERKRVSNVLYTPYEMFSESHAPGIQKLTNESARFKWYVVGVASSASQGEAISTENASRSQHKTSVHEESSTKLMKNASILISSKKN